LIIHFAYKKGGTMKSTFACSLAAHLADKHTVMLVDTDRGQYTANNWINDRNDAGYKPSIPCITVSSDIDLDKTLKLLDKEYDFVIVDGHGGESRENRTVMMVADAVVTPLAPTQADLDALKPWLDVIEDVRENIENPNRDLKIVAILTQYISQSRIEVAKQYLEHFPDYHLLNNAIKFRSSWQSIPEGKGASEMTQKANAPMRSEFLSVADELLKVIRK
jgi:chromosome partitioning protein